ncbi:isoaspartyl peptidase/L-asparaginase family protein [Sphingomonas lenta]|uniref:Isoaspartyl peptidase n=1 Tax=Sphingomonas lenta TaxID=1141887 RepID=A0A2A2SF89_9SPHN|nr:isoaspartyl peptidase/L-asparaginase family protein [Sphingomonas lenta]PAX07873.1 asparaginase [Sphingomonas lenta]
MPDARWLLVVHGGAKTIEPKKEEANRRGCLAAANAGATVLRYGGGAVQAVEAAIRSLEDDPTFNAGRGSSPQASGAIEMDASIMDGRDLSIGGVAGVKRLKHPIEAARVVLGKPPVLMVADGAERFAADHGVALIDLAELDPAETPNPERDTVGCVAIDMHGHLAAGTSTGGLEGMPEGRVGDTALPGAGLYADDAVGAVALSGDGEAIVRVMLAARITQAMENGSGPQAAAEAVLQQLARVNGEAGAIVLDRQGRIGAAHNSDHFALAVAGSDMEPRAALRARELADLLDE